MSDETAEKAIFEAERRKGDEYQASLRDYEEAGYEDSVTEWEQTFWEAGYKRGVRTGVMAGRASRDAEVSEIRDFALKAEDRRAEMFQRSLVVESHLEQVRRMATVDDAEVAELREQLAAAEAEVETRRAAVDEWIVEIIEYKQKLAAAEATIEKVRESARGLLIECGDDEPLMSALSVFETLTTYRGEKP
jgi:hypothetical protein